MRRMLFALLLGMFAAVVFAGAALALDLTGTEDRDKLIGSTGADTINAKGGADRVWAIGGGTKDDARDPVYDEVVWGGSGGDTLYGDDDPSPYFTKTGLKNRGFTEVGVPGSDKLVGGFGADTIYGGPENDYLSAGKGERTPRYDVLEGGPGEDVFWVDEAAYNAGLAAASPEEAKEAGADVIVDLEEGIDTVEYYDYGAEE